MKNLYLKTAYLYFIILACLGVTLRYISTYPAELNFKYILHTHSHIAFLGWVYSALFALYIYLFSTKNTSQLKIYKTQFILIQIVNLGMLISFPIQGYALFSILFSTLHIFISYWFAFTLNKDLNNNISIDSGTKHFAKAALLFMIISSAGPFTLPIMIKIFGTSSDPYYNTIYYYLHFQYNGWFTFSILAIVFRFMQLKGIVFEKHLQKKVFNLLFYSTFLTLFLSFLWSKPSILFNVMAGIGSIMQILFLLALYELFEIAENKNEYKLKAISKKILFIVVFCLITKCVFQIIGVIPYFSNLSYQIRNFIIGYLHLYLIGVISLSIIFISIENDYLTDSKSLRLSIYIFIAAFILSEIWIFLQGICWWLEFNGIPFYSKSLLIISTIMMLATFVFYRKSKLN